MSKKLIEITNPISSQIFQCEKIVEGEGVKAEIDLPLQAILDSGISAAIPRALYLKMERDPKEEVTIEIGPFTYGISLRKSGDSVSFNPTFSLTNEKKVINELGQYEEKLHKNIDFIESIAKTITDELLLDTVIHCCKLDEYDPVKGEWKEKVSVADKGADLEPYSASLFVATHVAAILHVLANSKNGDEIVKYEVPGEGTYTIQQKKDSWEIGFVAGKEFKQAIKNDRLVETLA